NDETVGDGGAERGCLNATEMYEYVSGMPSEDERTRIAAHVGSCERCLRALASLRDHATGAVTSPEKAAAMRTPDVSLPTPSDLQVVSRASYVFQGEHARGGIGRILRAEDRRLQRRVAVKELIQDNEAAARRFWSEAMLTARLQHPSIVPVYEAGCWPDGQ